MCDLEQEAINTSLLHGEVGSGGGADFESWPMRFAGAGRFVRLKLRDRVGCEFRISRTDARPVCAFVASVDAGQLRDDALGVLADLTAQFCFVDGVRDWAPVNFSIAAAKAA